MNNFKKIRLFLSVFCLLAAPLTNIVAAENAQDYAYGANLQLNDESKMFSKIELNQEVYTQTRSPNLDDIRVFNRNGETVPFALTSPNIVTPPSSTPVVMRIYPLDQELGNTNTTANQQNRYRITVNGSEVNIDVNQFVNEKSSYLNTYLLQIPDQVEINDNIVKLNLKMAQTDHNWQVTASLYSSRYNDLRSFNTEKRNVTLMTLKATDGQILTLNEIDLGNGRAARYWMLVLQSNTPIPYVESATAILEGKKSQQNDLFPISFSIQESSNKEVATYILPSVQPVKTLTIELANERSLLPVNIYYKSSDEQAEWHKLEDKILRKTSYHDKPDQLFFSSPKLMKQVQLRSINTPINQNPTLVAYREKQDLIFNSANNGPFILAWGTIDADKTALSPSALLGNISSSEIATAHIGESVKLGGEDVLKAKHLETSSIPNWVIWLALIAGAFILVWLAFKLSRELKK